MLIKVYSVLINLTELSSFDIELTAVVSSVCLMDCLFAFWQENTKKHHFMKQ